MERGINVNLLVANQVQDLYHYSIFQNADIMIYKTSFSLVVMCEYETWLLILIKIIISV